MDKLSVARAREAIKKGRKEGRVLHYSKAFERYSVEEEWHKGKAENIVINSADNSAL